MKEYAGQTLSPLCPSCSSANTQRSIQKQIPIIFKGNGFYVTDN